MSYLAARPDSDQIIAGVAQQGLWENSAGSDQWTKLGEAGPAQITNRTATIVFDPAAPDRYWESGSYAGPGAVSTTDGGQSFEALGDLMHLGGISVDLSDPNRQTLVAGSHERTDLYRSTDGGATWTNVGPNLPTSIGFAGQPLVLDAETSSPGHLDLHIRSHRDIPNDGRRRDLASGRDGRRGRPSPRGPRRDLLAARRTAGSFRASIAARHGSR